MNAAIPIAAVLAVRHFFFLLDMGQSQCSQMIYEHECVGGNKYYLTCASFLFAISVAIVLVHGFSTVALRDILAQRILCRKGLV